MPEKPGAYVEQFRRLSAAHRYADVIELAQRDEPAVLAKDETAYWFAYALIQTGSLDHALSILDQIVARNPSLAQVKADLCKLLIVMNHAERAAPLFEELESAALNDPRIYALLADAYLQAGRISDADRVLSLVADKFDDVQIYCWRIETLFRMGRTEEGLDIARQTLSRRGLIEATLQITGPVALLENDSALLAQCEQRLLNLPAPIAARLVDLWTSILSDGVHLSAAATAAGMATKVEPTSVRLRRLADLHLMNQDVDAAEHAVERAIEICATDARALTLLARCKIVRGEIETAKSVLLSAIKADPGCAAAYEYLAQIDTAAVSPQMVAHMESLCASEEIDSSDRCKLLLALARRNELDGDYKRAFDRLIKAKAAIADAARALGRGYDPAQTESLARSLGRIYARRPPHPDIESERVRPVFIVGMPRSGTSLVEQILAAHPAVFGGGELQAMPPILKDFLSRVQNEMPSKPLPSSHIRAMRDQYLKRLPVEAFAHSLFTDKNPLNFWSIGLIKSLFPDSIVIHLNRSAADTCLSILRARFTREFACANEIESVAHYYACYEAMMAHWRKIFGGEILDVDYEALTEAPESGVRALIARCGLEWNDTCLSFHKSKRSVHTHSAAQVREPIHRHSVNRREQYGASLAPLQKALEHYRDKLSGLFDDIECLSAAKASRERNEAKPPS